MAFCDYHACDRCGERKTFYDANMNFEDQPDGSFTYDGCKVFALCLASVHDGDSLTLCDGTKVRLVAEAGPMDAPELPGSPRCKRCDPKPGYAARDRLRVILSQPGWLLCDGTDRYKRALCRVRVNGKDVGDMLVAEGHAVIRDDWR